MRGQASLSEGKITEGVYLLIRDQRYPEAAAAVECLLQQQLELGDSQAFHRLLALLAYCFYMMKNFVGAAQLYSQLQDAFPDVAEYGLYKVYSLLQCTASLVTPALSTRLRYFLDSSTMGSPLNLHEGAYTHSFERCSYSDLQPTDAALFESASLCKAGNFDKGRQVATTAIKANGWSPGLAYNEALCAFKSGDMEAALRIAEGIVSCATHEDAIFDGEGNLQDLPGGHTGVERQCVSLSAHENALVEAVNLCCAVEIANNRLGSARARLELLSQRPPGSVDCVTLHNQALAIASSDPTKSLNSLEGLLNESFCPLTTIPNLLFLYCKHGYLEHATKLLLRSTPHEARRRLELLLWRIAEQTCRLNGRIQSSPHATSEVAGKAMETASQQALGSLLPVMMALVGAYCREKKFTKAEAVLRRFESLCAKETSWIINMGHVLFMQKKYAECLRFYGHINQDKVGKRTLQGWEAVALANALGANLMLGHLERAQQLLNLLNVTECVSVTQDTLHVNTLWWDEELNCLPRSSTAKLVIATLYCAEKAYDYGLKTAAEGLEPMERLLNRDTWSHVKACVAALLTDVSLGAILLEDQLAGYVGEFLRRVETKASEGCSPLTVEMQVIANEARALRQLLIRLA